EGEKVWSLWPGVGLDRLQQWARSGTLPSTPCVSLRLYPGCLLIMPPAVLHAVWSLTDVLMSGTNHWDSRDMVRVMQITKCVAELPHLSNDGIAKEFDQKVKKILTLWEAKSPAWPWGTEDALVEFRKLVMVS